MTILSSQYLLLVVLRSTVCIDALFYNRELIYALVGIARSVMHNVHNK